MAKADESSIISHLEQGALTISEIIRELGEMGIIPFDMRSGLDHSSISGDALWRPMIGVSANSNSECHYLFTIAAMAGWTAEYEIQGRGIVMRRTTSDAEETLGSWALLLNAARTVMGEIGSLT